jgi:hypothetical protein
MASGGRVDLACAAAGIKPDQLRAFRVARPALNAEWQLAREESADAFAEKGLAELEKELPTQAAVGAARARADYYRWLASKRNPRTYSEKAQLDVNVKTIDLTRIIEAANARIIESQAVRVIGHKTGSDHASPARVPALHDATHNSQAELADLM